MHKTDYKGQIVWIIGASSGIGLALAQELCLRGAILALSARREHELEQIQATIGNRHKIFVLDVTRAENTLATAQAIYAEFGQLDRIIFLAAAYEPMEIDALNISMTKAIVDVNLMGAFNMLYAAVPILKNQKSKGQIALCGSISGYIGLPAGQPYSATKAAIINLAESLYAECRDFLDVKLINPGFVSTALTKKNTFSMPMIMEPEQAAKVIADELLGSAFEIHFPKRMTNLIKILRLLPYWISLRFTRKIKSI